MAKLVVNAMEEHGTKFYNQCIPTKIEADAPTGKLKVTYKDSHKPNECVELFDTVLYAIGMISLVPSNSCGG